MYESRIYRSGESRIFPWKIPEGKRRRDYGFTSANHRNQLNQQQIFTNTKLYKSIENILSDSDTLFITVPDGQISKVWDYMKNLDIKIKYLSLQRFDFI